MSAVRISIESLRLSLTGISPDLARLAVDGLGPELELRLAARLASSPSFGTGLAARGGMEDAPEPGTRGTRSLGTVESKVPLDAAGLRSLIAERLLHALEDPATPSALGAQVRPRGGGG